MATWIRIAMVLFVVFISYLGIPRTSFILGGEYLDWSWMTHPYLAYVTTSTFLIETRKVDLNYYRFIYNIIPAFDQSWIGSWCKDKAREKFHFSKVFIWIYWILWKSIFECRKRYLDYLLTGLEERHLSIKLLNLGWEHPNRTNSGRTWEFDKFNKIVIFQFYLFDSKNDQM